MALMTAPDLATGRKLAKAALANRLIACANLVRGVESHYWWRGKVESASETLILMKTTRGKLAALERLILRHHPYDTPELVVLALHSGTDRYLAWLRQSVRTAA